MKKWSMKISNAYNSSGFNKNVVATYKYFPEPEQMGKIENDDDIEIDWKIITLIVLISFATIFITTTIIFVCYRKCCNKSKIPCATV